MKKTRGLWKSAWTICLVSTGLFAGCVKRVSLPIQKRIVDPVSAKCTCEALPVDAVISDFILMGVERYREMVDALDYCIDNGYLEEKEE